MHLRGPGETTNVLSPKRKCRNFDEIFITDYTGSCHFDNFQCSLWWKFHQNNIPVSLLIKKILETYSRNLQLHHSLATLSAWLAFCEGNPLQGTYGSPTKIQHCGPLVLSILSAWISFCSNSGFTDDMRHHEATMTSAVIYQWKSSVRLNLRASKHRICGMYS